MIFCWSKVVYQVNQLVVKLVNHLDPFGPATDYKLVARNHINHNVSLEAASNWIWKNGKKILLTHACTNKHTSPLFCHPSVPHSLEREWSKYLTYTTTSNNSTSISAWVWGRLRCAVRVKFTARSEILGGLEWKIRTIWMAAIYCC